MGKGGRAGRIKGEIGGYRERKEGRGREGNERNERGIVPHPKVNPGCATDHSVCNINRI